MNAFVTGWALCSFLGRLIYDPLFEVPPDAWIPVGLFLFFALCCETLTDFESSPQAAACETHRTPGPPWHKLET